MHNGLYILKNHTFAKGFLVEKHFLSLFLKRESGETPELYPQL